ncbi:MAG TPA: caspase family protein [Hyphomicrobiaceae bacterium]|nr:caspase family protein [Hyphomicrobiaceae bacterium]
MPATASVDGQNYLIPIDARLERVGDVELEALSLRLAMSQLEGTRILSLIVLDACRNNPFRARMVQRAGKRSIGRGLASVEPDQNTLVAFAAREGTTADDGEGNSSPFTLALARHIETTNLDVRILFGRVRDEVMRTTNRQQQPHVYGSLGGTSIFLAGNRR